VKFEEKFDFFVNFDKKKAKFSFKKSNSLKTKPISPPFQDVKRVRDEAFTIQYLNIFRDDKGFNNFGQFFSEVKN
jgi:hypothetical protein